MLPQFLWNRDFFTLLDALPKFKFRKSMVNEFKELSKNNF